MIVDKNDDVLYYGRIAQKSESGTATVTIPADIAPGEYRLKIFNEQCNDDYRTDYASDFVNIDLTIREKLSEQFNLSPGEKYYFDLSGLNIPGTVNSYLLDSSLHYVPFVYTGTVDAYVLKPASNHVADSSKQASDTLDPNAQYGYTYDHSLFIADEPITGNVSWADLNEKGFIFGNSYVTNGINYTLRAPTVGSTLNSSNTEMPDPSNNEWNRIINKNKKYIKTQLFGFDLNWGQDNYNEDYLNKKSTRSVNFNNSLRGTEEENKIGTYYRPVLEILDAKTLGSEGLKAITLNLNGGKLGGNGDDIKIVVKNNDTYTAPSYEGLTRPDGNSDTYFYWLDSDGNAYIPGGAVSSDVTTLTAKWEPLKYSVTLKANGGVINNNNIIEYVYGQGATLPSTSDMEKEYHTFGGWYTSSDFSGSPVIEISHVDKGDKVYYAKWNANQYTITFDTDGGSVVSPITQDYGTRIDKPSDPTKEGYTFMVWDNAIPNTMPAHDMLIKALWKINKYTVTFDSDGGSNIDPITLDYGSVITNPSNPTKTGHIFGGWFKDGTLFDFNAPLTMDITLKANWIKDDFIVKFDTDGGGIIADKTSVKWNDKLLDGVLAPNKTGHTFNEWKYNGIVVTENTKYSDLAGESVPTSIILKAYWTANQYSITFDTDGGSVVSPITQDYGTTVVKPSNPAKTGYVFAGWLKNGILFDFNTPLVDDITLKANWIKDNFTVKFDADGGSLIADKTNVKWNDKVLEDVIAPTKTGYTFNAWKYNNTVVTENTKYSDLAGDSVPTSITLKADWNVNQYTISFDTDGGSAVPSITLDYGSTVIVPISPTKVGFTFNGWDKVIPSTMPSNDMTIKALWKINKYTIIFDTNGGSAIEAITLDYGSTIVKPLDPTRSGYAFVGWDLSIPSTMPPYDMTIKAKWLDSEKPSGEIKVATNSWKTLLNSITFGLFFKDSQTVSINAYDNSNEEVKIEYLLSNNILSITELDNQSFNLYTRPFSVNPNNEYVIYAKLTDTSNNISYISSDGLVLDDISPLISGVEDNKTYCEKKTVTVNDKYINSVKVNGNDVTLDSNNSFILGYGKQNIIVTDRSGNRSEVNVTINNGHLFGGYNFDGVDTHTRKCNVCGKTVSSHKGGETTCTKKSICDICGQEYGELSKHLNLKHIEETKATTTSTGNKEYWYCEECNRYYSDEDGLNEISKEDTVIERLKDDNTNKDDNNIVEIEHKDSNPIIWAVVPIVGVAIISGIILIIKRKR